jgi:hypothetical protein
VAERVVLRVESEPDNATVKRDGKKLGRTPFEVEVARDSGATELVVSKTGYRSATVVLDPETRPSARVTLEPRRPAPGEPHKPPEEVGPFDPFAD